MHDERHGSIDWALLQSWYNNEVGLVKTDEGVSDEDKQGYVFANESQLRSAFATLSEAALQREILTGPLMEECKRLQKKLKNSVDTLFPPAVLSGAPSSSASSSSSSSSSSAVADSNAMATAGESARVGDWTQYPVCVRTKVCKLEDGREWTKALLEQRLDVLRRVRWCLCCDEVCQVRSDRNAKWSDAEIIGDYHRKNTRTTNDGSAYPECNKTGEWKSLKHNRQMMNRRAYEIRKLQGKVAKCVAPAAAGQRQKKKLKKRKS